MVLSPDHPFNQIHQHTYNLGSIENVSISFSSHILSPKCKGGGGWSQQFYNFTTFCFEPFFELKWTLLHNLTKESSRRLHQVCYWVKKTKLFYIYLVYFCSIQLMLIWKFWFCRIRVELLRVQHQWWTKWEYTKLCIK